MRIAACVMRERYSTSNGSSMIPRRTRLYAMDNLGAKWMKIGSVVAAYWFISITMVFVNKYLLSSPDLKLDAPLFITWFQCVVTVFLCAVLSLVSMLAPNLITFPAFKIDLKLCRETLPLSLIFVSMISCNNLCLKYVGVSFYFVGRSLTTVFNVILSYIILKQGTSLKALICCSIIVFGFFLGVDQETVSDSYSLGGVIFGVMASVFVSLNAIYTKKVLPLVDHNVFRLSMYNNLNAIFLFIPLMFLFNEPVVLLSFSKFNDIHMWTMMIVGGVFGFAIGAVAGLQIQITSPLTHNISGTAKACVQTVLACLIFKEMHTSLWWLSNLTVLSGSGGYTEVRRQEMIQQASSTKTVEKEKSDGPEKQHDVEA